MRLAGIAACAVAVAACDVAPEVAECPNLPIKGWNELLASPAFSALSHRREQRYDPMTEMSQILWSDSSFSYERLLTLDVAHPRFAQGAAEERCIRGVSFMSAWPPKAPRVDTLSAFIAFLGSRGAPAPVVKAIEAARDRGAPFAPVGAIAGAPVSAGVVEQGARGGFFRVEVTAAK